jgi:DNA-binding XRE family transcriptional regulator
MKISLDILCPMVIMIVMTREDLKRWRQSNGYTQQQLADALGVFQTTIARWETSVRAIPSFLGLALEALEARGGDRKSRATGTKTRKHLGDVGSI